MKYYVNHKNGEIYCGDMQEGDREATPEEVEAFLHPIPTNEEQRVKRAEAYRMEKDPITCQIQALKDEEQTPEIEQEIEELKQQRALIIEDIKNRYPYYENDADT